MLQPQTRIGLTTLPLATDQRDGLFLRAGDRNVLYYARDFVRTMRLLSILETEGRKAAKHASEEDPAIGSVWADMSRLGFFFDHPTPNPMIFRFHLNAGGDEKAMVDAFVPVARSAELTGIPFCATCEGVTDMIAAAERANRISRRILEKLADGSEEKGAGEKPTANLPYSLVCFCGFHGETTPPQGLLSLLDSERVTAIVDIAVGEEKDRTRWECIEALEREGYVLPVRITAGAGQVQDKKQAEAWVDRIHTILSASPRRDVDLRFPIPSSFASVFEVNRYFDGLDRMLERLWALDADVSRLSCFQRHILGLTYRSHVGNVLDLRASADSAEIVASVDDVVVGQFPATREAFEQFRGEFSRAQLGESDPEPCRACDFREFCPKHSAECIQSGLGMDSSPVAKRLFERRCANRRTVMTRVLEEFLRICRENADRGAPLQLHILDGGGIAFSPLAPTVQVHHA